MFTRTSKLKTIFKEAYKAVLNIGLTKDNVYIIDGAMFKLVCPAESIDNEVLAELVKLTGGLPGKGEAISYSDGKDPQMTSIEFLYENLFEQWEEAQITIEPTRMMISTEGDIQVVYQSITPNKKLMVPARLHNCIGESRGEDEHRKEIRLTKDNELIVISDVMALRLSTHILKWIPEKEILDACSSIDLNWKTLDINLL